MEDRGYVEGQLLVTFEKTNISLKQAKKIISRHRRSISVSNRVGTLNIFLVLVPVGKEENWKRKLEKNKKIQHVAFVGKVKALQKK